jgi:hypothetical protein
VRVSASIYGLGVEADAPVAALRDLPAAGAIDVRWHLEALPAGYDRIPASAWEGYGAARGEPDEETQVRAAFAARHGLYRLLYEDGTVVVIDASGREVWATRPRGASIEDTATYLLGPVMGFVLRLRGTPCLHASAVAFQGRALAIAAHAGGGKSSTAAAFARMGLPVLTDDVLAISRDAGGFQVRPAYPRVRLWPESVAAMFGAADALPRITPTWDKRYLPLSGEGFQREPVALGAIFLLDDRQAGGAAAFERLAPAEALVWLVAHGYSIRLLDRDMRAREFEWLSEVAARVPTWRVRPARDIGRIDDLCKDILRHASL